MNYTIISNPYKDDKSVISTRGVMTDAKVAKLNNDKKKPALVRHWEELRPEVTIPTVTVSTPKDYSSLLFNVGISPVNYGVLVTNSGAKKLRVNKIVIEKAKVVYNSSKKIDVHPIEPATVSPKMPEVIAKAQEVLMPNITNNQDNHGRHERTGEIPVNAINEVIKNDIPPVSIPTYTSRVEKNVIPEDINKVDNKESKAGDMDLYNNLLHNSVGPVEDVSRQLQGARNQLTIEKEESRKLAEQYGEAVKELAKLKEDIEVTKKQKEQKAKEELSMTLKSIENLQKENLERTSDLTSIQSEIARLKAEKQAIEANNF